MKRLVFFIALLCITTSIFSQTNWNFSTAATLSGSPWQATATINIGGVSYTITGGINGSYTNVSTGGNGNSAALKKDASGGDAFTISRTDGKRFQFYNLWLKQSSMYPYPNTPPFYTINFWNGSTLVKSYTVNSVSDQNSTKVYAENIAVTSVSVMFNALLTYYLDDLTVGPAAPSTDAALSNLGLSKGTLSPAFASGTYSYTASVGYGTSTINVTPTADDPIGATIKVNGVTVSSGTPQSVALSLGDNTITIVCTAEDGTTINTYTVIVNRSSTPDYCVPASDDSYGDDVNTFTLAGESGTSIVDNNTGSSGGYDYRSSVPTLKLLQGNSYNGTVTTDGEAYSSTDGEHIKIWIDYNDDYLFESNELLYQSPALILAGTTLNYNVSVAANANPGNHRMRVRAVYEDPYDQTNFDGCSDEDYGETQDYNIDILPLNPLPLTLISLNAVQADNNVNVKWTSSAQVNLDRFEVEKSNDGVTFSKAATVQSKQSSLDVNYSWLDEQPLQGANYYRLKMVDNNGNFSYSEVVKVTINGKSGFIKVAPNPVMNNELGLQLQNLTTGVYQVQLFDALGQKVFSTTVNNNSNSSVNIMELPASVKNGVYRLQVTDKKNVYITSVLFR